jgi:hypothetical protein
MDAATLALANLRRVNHKLGEPAASLDDLRGSELAAAAEQARAALLAADAAPVDGELPLILTLLARLREATPLPWRWWTSNSFRRLTGEANSRDRRDGSVLSPLVAGDGHPDCAISAADMALIEEGVNAMPLLLTIAAQNGRLRLWVRDLQSGLYVNCVYCGHRYGPGETTPVSMADALKAHVAQCAYHPMAALIKALFAASHALKSYAHGNASPDLARDVAKQADEALFAATDPRPFGGGQS